MTRRLPASGPVSRRLLLAVVLAVAAAPRGLSAQEVDPHQRWEGATWVDDLNFLSANAVLAGVAAGVKGLLHHRSFSEAFTRGALGGAVSYLGKRVVVARFGGAGFLAREINAVGASMTRNAGLGVGLLDTLWLPVGPVLATVDPGHLGSARFRVDLNQASWLVAALAEDRLELDWSKTLSAGTPVFQATRQIEDRGEPADGLMAGGLVFLSPKLGDQTGDVFAHERVHVLQRDFVETVVGLSLEEWTAPKLRLDRIPLFERVVPGVGYLPLDYFLVGPWRKSRRLYEVEAYFLETR